jgi:hypothetical protein
MYTLTFKNIDIDKYYTTHEYSCDFTVTTAGDGYWGCEEGRVVHVTGISVVTSAVEDNACVTITVAHDSTWDIYTDTAFEAAISAALGKAVTFTEQGMQDDELASMEF